MPPATPAVQPDLRVLLCPEEGEPAREGGDRIVPQGAHRAFGHIDRTPARLRVFLPYRGAFAVLEGAFNTQLPGDPLKEVLGSLARAQRGQAHQIVAEIV